MKNKEREMMEAIVTEALVFIWLCRNPGKDDEDVANEFDMSPVAASDIVTKLLSEGLLGFDE